MLESRLLEIPLIGDPGELGGCLVDCCNPLLDCQTLVWIENWEKDSLL